MSWHSAVPKLPGRRSGARGGGVAAAIATSVLGVGALAGPAAAATNYTFQTLNNNHDTTFNQLLGINNNGVIAGYFGSGASGHPNKGYLLRPPYGPGRYINENFPHSAQTQVTGLNNNGVTVGFWANAAGDNFGWYAVHRKHFKIADSPGNTKAKPRVDQLLGVNDGNIAVGFFNDSKGNAHGYVYNIVKHHYKSFGIAGASSVTATAINNLRDIAGFETQGNGNVVGFLKQSNGKLITLSYPGATMTQAFGVNDGDEVVGAYTVGTGASAVTHGFAWSPGWGFQTVDDPNGIGTTLLNGVNDRGQLVGFYTDSQKNVDGMLATP